MEGIVKASGSREEKINVATQGTERAMRSFAEVVEVPRLCSAYEGGVNQDCKARSLAFVASPPPAEEAEAEEDGEAKAVRILIAA